MYISVSLSKADCVTVGGEPGSVILGGLFGPCSGFFKGFKPGFVTLIKVLFPEQMFLQYCMENTSRIFDQIFGIWDFCR